MIRLLIVGNLLINTICAQSLPTIEKIEGRKFYLGMYNDIAINLNQVDPAMIKLKAGTSTLKKVNDSLYQIYVRDPQTIEEKIKLYYKNLPVDVFVVEVAGNPLSQINIVGGLKSDYTVEEFSKIEFEFIPEDDFFFNNGFSFFSITAKILRNNVTLPFMAFTSNNFGQSIRYKNKLIPGDRVFLTDARIKSALNQTIAVNCNYIEFLIR